jgi:secondary thiamine-phosphate synthase enzyme
LQGKHGTHNPVARNPEGAAVANNTKRTQAVLFQVFFITKARKNEITNQRPEPTYFFRVFALSCSRDEEQTERTTMTHQETQTFRTAGHRDMHDLTDAVAAIVARSGVQTGVANVFAVGSTAAVGVVEFEPGLVRDLPELLDRLIPPSRNYGHEQTWHDGNGHSHLQATLLGHSLAISITQGRLVLGTWQQIFHLECDIRPRDRSVVVTVLGE